MEILKNKATAALADDIIGAANTLEQAARQLKRRAKTIRQDGLTDWKTPGIEVFDNQRSHMAIDVKTAAAAAIQELKAVELVGNSLFF